MRWHVVMVALSLALVSTAGCRATLDHIIDASEMARVDFTQRFEQGQKLVHYFSRTADQFRSDRAQQSKVACEGRFTGRRCQCRYTFFSCRKPSPFGKLCDFAVAVVLRTHLINQNTEKSFGSEVDDAKLCVHSAQACATQ